MQEAGKSKNKREVLGAAWQQQTMRKPLQNKPNLRGDEVQLERHWDQGTANEDGVKQIETDQWQHR